MEALAASSVPLRTDGLALLLAHRQEEQVKEEAKRTYVVNLLYGILGSLHAMCNHDLQMPSYGEFVRMLDKPQKTVLHQTPQETWQAASDMLHLFLHDRAAV